MDTGQHRATAQPRTLDLDSVCGYNPGEMEIPHDPMHAFHVPHPRNCIEEW